MKSISESKIFFCHVYFKEEKSSISIYVTRYTNCYFTTRYTCVHTALQLHMFTSQFTQNDKVYLEFVEILTAVSYHFKEHLHKQLFESFPCSSFSQGQCDCCNITLNSNAALKFYPPFNITFISHSVAFSKRNEFNSCFLNQCCFQLFILQKPLTI